MRATGARPEVKVTADGKGVVSHAGAALVAELAERVGLTGALSEAMAHTRRRRSTQWSRRLRRLTQSYLATPDNLSRGHRPKPRPAPERCHGGERGRPIQAGGPHRRRLDP